MTAATQQTTRVRASKDVQHLHVGYDAGNATAVVASDAGVWSAPSRYTTIVSAIQEVSLSEHIVHWRDRVYLVGEPALDMPGETALFGNDERYSAASNLVYLYAGLAALYPDECIYNLHVHIGVPIALHAQAMHAATIYRRDDTFTARGAQRRIISECTLHAEAASAVLVVPEAREGNVIVVDAGGRTVNVALFRHGAYRDGHTYQHGVEPALAQFATARPLSVYERYALQRAYARGTPYHINVDGRRLRIDRDYAAYAAGYARTVYDALALRVPFSRADLVVLIGGGAYMLAPTWRTLVRHIHVPDQPETVNARAFLRARGVS